MGSLPRVTEATSHPALVAPWRIGVDVGGTFTDMVLRDAAGAVRISKSPSVPADPSEGVLEVLRLAAQQLDLSLTALLRDCALFVHGSTVATNTILEKKGAKVGMLNDKGAFAIGSRSAAASGKTNGITARPSRRCWCRYYLRLPVRGRIGADGAELAPCSLKTSMPPPKSSPTKVSNRSPSACSIPSSTARTNARGGQLAKSWNGKWVSLSSEVMPTMGEYERGSTAVVNV